MSSPPADVTSNGGTLRRSPPETGAKPYTRIISPSKTVNSPHKILPKDMEDLIHLQGPLTEDAVMRTLQARFNEGKYIVSIPNHIANTKILPSIQ